jgi:hypothetical protein
MKTPFIFLLLFPASGVQARRAGDAVSFYGSRFRIVQAEKNTAALQLSCGLSGVQITNENGEAAAVKISSMEILIAGQLLGIQASEGKPFPAQLLFHAIQHCKKGEQIRLENIRTCDRRGKEQPYLVEPLTLEKI